MNERTALVTGANKGIGKHIARLLTAEGLTVYVGSRDPGAGSGPSRSTEPGPVYWSST